MARKILGASLGNCIHVGGLLNFLKLAEAEGYQTIFVGSSISPAELIPAMQQHRPELVAVSYRLTPEVARNLFKELQKEIARAKFKNIRLILGGTAPVAKVGQKVGIFDRIFDGTESLEEIKAYLKGVAGKKSETVEPSNTLLERIKQKLPVPLLRHHFGLPTLKDTIAGAKTIANSGVLDVLSIGPDQNAQEHFFHPANMDPAQDGAGGVPLRKAEDLKAIYQATRSGNFPLVRCYAGTNDLIKWAEMSVKTIDIAWGAIPLCWYSVLDRRSKRELKEAIKENQSTIKWYAQHSIPVEVNESHQWSLRQAHDALAVVMAFLAAYNAKKLGVRHYVSQYMFNTPAGISGSMDLAKMLAKKELIDGLVDKDFTVFTQVRAGLASLSPDRFVAKGQLAASAVLSLALRPHILHVVGFSEADHAIKPDELIESCRIIQGVVSNALSNFPDFTLDPKVQARKAELIDEAKQLLDALKRLGQSDPWTNPKVLTQAVEIGLLDAPHLKGNKPGQGAIETRLVNGACYAIDPGSDKILTETKRIKQILS